HAGHGRDAGQAHRHREGDGPEGGRRHGAVTEAASAARVLVVTHEEEVRVLLRRLLRSVGHEVTLAAGGTEALSALDEPSLRLVLLDLALPRRAAWPVLARAHAAPASPPVVALVGRADYRSFAQAVRDGAAACVFK